MRKELADLKQSGGGLTDYDLCRTLWIAKQLNSGRFELMLRHQREVAKETDNEQDFWNYVDDINWYGIQEAYFVWHFCLWRLQSVFEGILMSTCLAPQPPKSLLGLKQKLDAVRKLGYEIQDNDYQALLDWAEIRNSLSHFPPSSHDPGPLQQSDVEEYHDLLVKIVAQLNDQKQKR